MKAIVKQLSSAVVVLFLSILPVVSAADGIPFGLFIPFESGFIDRAPFFSPIAVVESPSGIFGDMATGFFDAPLQEAFMNPALLGAVVNSGQFFYADFRTLPKLERRVNYPGRYWGWGANRLADYFPWNPSRTVRTAADEPMFNAAWLYRPEGFPRFTIGFSISYSSSADAYYDQYFDATFAPRGRTFLSVDGIPIERHPTDIHRMRTIAPAVMLSMRISDRVRGGLRFGVASIISNGVHQSSGPAPRYIFLSEADNHGSALPLQAPEIDYQYTDRNVDQSYSHYEMNAGFEMDISEKWTWGASAGLLRGDTDQRFGLDDADRYRWTLEFDEGVWYEESNIISAAQYWDRTGYRTGGTMYIQRLYGAYPANRMRLFYRWTFASIDHTSNANRNLSMEMDERFYDIENDGYNRSLLRAGSFANVVEEGDISRWSHRIGLSVITGLSGTIDILYGLQAAWNAHNSNIEERLDVHRDVTNETWSTSVFEGSRQLVSFRESIEAGRRNRLSSVVLPVFIRARFPYGFAVEGGALVLFDSYRDTYRHRHTGDGGSIVTEGGTTWQPGASYSWEDRWTQTETMFGGTITVYYTVLTNMRIRLTGAANSTSDRVNMGTTRLLVGMELGL